LLASTGYYISFIPVFLTLVIFIAIFNYFSARWLINTDVQSRKYRLAVIIIFNLLILALFKYFGLLFPDIHVHLSTFNLFENSEPITRIILPLGLSYLIFTVLSYQIELKRNTIQPETNLGIFTLYLMFFPRIAQGPIERPNTLLPQLRQTNLFDYDMFLEGLKLIIWGYFKKLVVADRLALYVNAVYNNNAHHNGTTLAIATIFFTFQIYADFSGYTDIALGSARLFGIRLTNNFNRPYLSVSIKEFWNRWHITFSTWLRDYIFLPIAFYLSKKMRKERYLLIQTEKWIYLAGIMITFIICGIWHGEGWTYLVWGILFGIYLTFFNWTEKTWKNFRKRMHIRKSSGYAMTFNILLTFILVSFAWILFRASSLHEALSIIEKIFTNHGAVFNPDWQIVLYGVFGIFILLGIEIIQEYLTKSILPFIHKSWFIEEFVYAVLVITILMIGVFDGGQFIYFQF
jgi:D-alanyl-lipoteichoic acid acyltransferase DltB (MBOAT superfamily)